ncbi:N-acetylmuramoyl-L-alanine amidase [Chungangia koreensis]|uniref:N-acetylmuramoyl-L-alanine amidase n=1 Tax=Chungangia koreensis TaxID=752657 RepID=A0ABV8X5V0_9LACT
MPSNFTQDYGLDFQLCYDPEEITNGVGNHNSYTYHICVVGNGSFTAAQEEAFEERCKLAMKRLNIPVERVLGHKEFKGASTSCPGIDMNLVRNRLKKSLNEVKTAQKEEPKMPEYKKDAAPSKSLAKEFNATVELKITDGTYPQRPVMREEAAVMAYRAYEKAMNNK